MPLRDLELLRPDVRAKCEKWLTNVAIRGVPCVVVETGRDLKTQMAYWLQSRAGLADVNAARHEAGLAPITEEQNALPVTHCKPGQTKHGHIENGQLQSLAFDAYPSFFINQVGLDKLAEYGDDPRWEIMGDAAAEVGLQWGGLWPARKCDRPHFENLGG